MFFILQFYDNVWSQIATFANEIKQLFLTSSEPGTSYSALKKTRAGLLKVMIIRGANSQQSRHECLEVTKIIFSVGDWLKGKMVEEIDITNISYKIPKRNLIAYPLQV